MWVRKCFGTPPPTQPAFIEESSLVGVCVCAVFFYYLHWFLKQDFSNDFAMLHMLAAEENKRLLRQADVLNV